jgi:methylglutaconyl-CoA hydratase
VHEVAAPDRLDGAVGALASQLRASGPRAIAEIKALYGRLPPAPVTAETLELTAQTIARIRHTDEAREGFTAFLEKRRPRWAEDE